MTNVGENRNGEETYIPMQMAHHEYHMDCSAIKFGPSRRGDGDQKPQPYYGPR
jgi:hypothetical protein